MTTAQRYKRYFPNGEIGPVAGPDAFKAFPPLQGDSNWIYWQRDFHRALGAENAAYLAILNGECKAPASPRFLSTEEADVQVSYYRWVMTAVQFASYEESKKLLPKPTVEALHREKDEIEALNAKLHDEYEKHLGLFGTAQARIMCCLSLCVDDLVSPVIENEQDPFRAFEMLRKRFDNNSLLEQRFRVYKKKLMQHYISPQPIIRRYQAWNEIRYQGKYAIGFVVRFKQAKNQYEDCISGTIPFELEYPAFINAFMENHRCVLFVRKFKPSNAETMYREFLEFESSH